MTPQTRGRMLAELLLQAGAIRVSHERPLILAAGWASPVYVDCRRLMDQPAIRTEVISLLVDYVRSEIGIAGFDAVAGGETAGIPFASLVAQAFSSRLRYVRKRPLGIGHNAQLEGGPAEGLRVLLVDDLTADGASKLAFIRGIRLSGASVENVLTIFYYDAFAGARERLSKAGVRLHALATWADILSIADGLPERDRCVVEEFISDPAAWSIKHGGRAKL